jgi:hypothetical protein
MDLRAIRERLETMIGQLDEMVSAIDKMPAPEAEVPPETIATTPPVEDRV